jgi:hypothetical protein
MVMTRTLQIATACFALSAGPVFAVPIAGLYNTGVDNAGNALVGGDGVADPHWNYGANDAFTYTHPFYLANSSISRWISPNANGSGPSNYALTLTFDLTGFDAATASISGRWAADNCGSVSLNGGAGTGVIGLCNDLISFGQFTPFSFASGFVAGLNTITLNMQDTGNPTAGRVEFLQSSVNRPPVGVPEPSTLALLALGLLAFGRRARNSASRSAV